MRRSGLDLRGWIAYPSVWFSPVSETVQTYPSAGVCTIDRGQKSPPHGICGTITAQKTKYLSWSCASSYSFPFPPQVHPSPKHLQNNQCKKAKSSCVWQAPPSLDKWIYSMNVTYKERSLLGKFILLQASNIRYVCFAFNLIPKSKM